MRVIVVFAMSEEQLSALLTKLKEDAGLQEKFKCAANPDAAVEIAKEAGFDMSKADWIKYQANQTLQLSNEELEQVSGGIDGRLEQRVVPKQEWSVDWCPPVP